MKRKLAALVLFALGCVCICFGLKFFEAPDWLAFTAITFGVIALAVLMWIADQALARRDERRALAEEAGDHARFLARIGVALPAGSRIDALWINNVPVFGTAPRAVSDDNFADFTGYEHHLPFAMPGEVG